MRDLIVTAVLAPAGAILGSYLAARVTSARQLGYERLVEAADRFTSLLHELANDYFLWISQLTAQERIYTGRIIGEKLRLLYTYRDRYWMRLDTQTSEALEVVIGQLNEHHAEVSNAYPGSFRGLSTNVYVKDLPEDPRYEKAVGRTRDWLDNRLPDSLERLESSFNRSLGTFERPWWRRKLGA